MFLRSKICRKDGKEHRAWSVVENRRVHDGRVVQRQVLYLGEINDSQRAAWSKAIEVFDEGAGQPKQIALFPEDRVAPVLDCDVVSIRLSDMRLRRPRQWGACWMATLLWDQLRLDEFWFAALPPSREGTNWLNILKTLVGYQLISPGSEWRLHRHWFEHSAMGDLLGEDLALVQPNNLYRCLDKLTAHTPSRLSQPDSVQAPLASADATAYPRLQKNQQASPQICPIMQRWCEIYGLAVRISIQSQCSSSSDFSIAFRDAVSNPKCNRAA